MKVAENKQLVCGINLDIVPVMCIFLASHYLSAVTFCYSIYDKSVFWWVVYIEQYWNSFTENQLVSMLWPCFWEVTFIIYVSYLQWTLILKILVHLCVNACPCPISSQIQIPPLVLNLKLYFRLLQLRYAELAFVLLFSVWCPHPLGTSAW